jgi:hypothetical protein
MWTACEIIQRSPLQTTKRGYLLNHEKYGNANLRHAKILNGGPSQIYYQLYVLLSRLTSPDGLCVLIENNPPEQTDSTHNVVYKQIFSFH